MKRFALVVLIISLILSQFGCSGLFPEQQEPNALPVTDGERDMLRKYYEAMCLLNNYEKTGFVKFFGKDRIYYDTEALARYHDYFRNLEGFDELVAREDVKQYIQEYFYEKVNWDRKAVIRKFFALENIKLSEIRVARDDLGNVNRNAECHWIYDKNGYVQRESDANNFFEQIETNPLEIGGYRTYTRDETGRVTQIKYVELTYGNVEALVSPVYDDQGRVIREEVQQKVDLIYIDYTYDEAGRLTTIQANTANELFISYTYDEQGNVKREEKVYLGVRDVRYVKSMEYTYDERGYLSSAEYRYEAWYPEEGVENLTDGDVQRYLYWDQVNQHRYMCDGEGKLISNSVTYGDRIFRSGDRIGEVASPSSYNHADYTFVYGDYYLYGDR